MPTNLLTPVPSDEPGKDRASAPEADAHHNSLYDHPDLFDLAYPGHKGDVDFYMRHTRDGMALYLGVGTGRIFAPMYRQNDDVIGMDNCPKMVARLFQKYPDISQDAVKIQDVRDNSGGNRWPHRVFDKVVAPYSFLTQFSGEPESDDINRILWHVQRSLKKGGLFITDLFSPHKNPPAKVRTEHERIAIPERDMLITIDRDYVHEEDDDFTEVARVHERGIEILQCKLHLQTYRNKDLKRWAQNARLVIDKRLGDFHEETPFNAEESDTMIYFMRNAG